MKPSFRSTLPLLAAVCALATAGNARAQADPAPRDAGGSAKVKMRDAATHDYLERALRYSRGIDPMNKMQAVEGEDPSKSNLPEDLLSSSDIISYNGHTTLVPKRAILGIPPQYRDRLGKHVPGSKVVSWKDFHLLNRGWISTVEVSRPQAEGNAPLGDGVAKLTAKPANLIVATLLGGPISVLPPKEPAEEPTTESPTAATP